MRLTPPACALRRNGALKSGVQAQRASPPHNYGLCQTKSWLEQINGAGSLVWANPLTNAQPKRSLIMRS
jgi:hypothetical protein